MLRAGLTGGVGSGKSAAAAIFQECGAVVSSSDDIGRRLMQPGQEVFRNILEHFGPGVLTREGLLDRGILARLAFEDGRAEELNAIVHPAVIQEQQRWMASIERQDANAVAIVESALIFETRWGESGSATPWRTRFDRIIIVTAPAELRQARYIRRLDGSVQAPAAAADFQQRAAAQWPDEQKTPLADYVLENDGTLEELRSAVVHLFAGLREESIDRAAEAM